VKFSEKQPSVAELLQDENPLPALSSFLMSKNTDSIKSSVNGEQCRVHFHFDH